MLSVGWTQTSTHNGTDNASRVAHIFVLVSFEETFPERHTDTCQQTTITGCGGNELALRFMLFLLAKSTAFRAHPWSHIIFCPDSAVANSDRLAMEAVFGEFAITNVADDVLTIEFARTYALTEEVGKRKAVVVALEECGYTEPEIRSAFERDPALATAMGVAFVGASMRDAVSGKQ